MEQRPTLTETLTQLLEPSLSTTDTHDTTITTHGFPVLVIRHSERLDESHPDVWKRLVAQATKKHPTTATSTTIDDRDHYSFSHDPPLSDPHGLQLAEEVAVTIANALRPFTELHPPPTTTTTTTAAAVESIDAPVCTLPPIVPSSPMPAVPRQSPRPRPPRPLHVHLYCSRTIRTVQTAVAIARRLAATAATTTEAPPVIVLSRGLSRILSCVQKRDQQQPPFQFVSVATWQGTSAGGLPWRATWRHILRHHCALLSPTVTTATAATEQASWVLPIIVGHRETIRHLHADANGPGQRLGPLPYCAVAVFHVTPPAAEATTTTAANALTSAMAAVS
eukprot:gene17889-12824_t